MSETIDPTARANKSQVQAFLDRWRRPGAEGFVNWLSDAQIIVPGGAEGFVRYEPPTGWLLSEIEKGLSPGIHTWVLSFPRRFGKTTLSALLMAHRLTTTPGTTGAIVANSAAQGSDTVYRVLRTILERSPMYKARISAGDLVVNDGGVHWSKVGSKIDVLPNNEASAHGRFLSIAAVSELHAARDDGVLQTLSTATLDHPNGLVLIDSHAGPRTSPIWALWNLDQAGTDPTLVYSHLEFRDVDDLIDNLPPWIKAERVLSRQRMMLQSEFALQFLNQWAAADAGAFPPEVIARCVHDYPLSVEELATGRQYVVGAGLDRALVWSKHGDATVLTSTLKVIDPADESPHFFVLDTHAFDLSTEIEIKRRIERSRREFGLRKIAFERYESSDLSLWADAAGLDATLLHATRQQQAIAFSEMVLAAREGRLHIHPKFERLIAELGTFQYEMKATGTSEGIVPVFSHAKGCNDDHVYSAAWSMYAVREVELATYSMNGISCGAQKHVAELCLLNGGRLVPPCNRECRSFTELRHLYGGYRSRVTGTPLEIEDFFEQRVTNAGSHSLVR